MCNLEVVMAYGKSLVFGFWAFWALTKPSISMGISISLRWNFSYFVIVEQYKSLLIFMNDPFWLILAMKKM